MAAPVQRKLKNDFRFVYIDRFLGEHHEKKELLKVNPFGSLPTIVDNKTVVMGNYQVFINYLVSMNEDLRKSLYPEDLK
jgi:glutathione S-transferase